MSTQNVEKALELATERLKPMKKPSLKPAPKVEAALIVLLDVSGSMAESITVGESKLSAAFKSFKDVLTKHLAGWHLGILLFGLSEGDGVQWLLPPTNHVELDMIREPSPQGGTPMLPALRQAWAWLSNRAESGRIILLTDGLPNQDGRQADILIELEKHSRVPIDCIGLGVEGKYSYDRIFLQRLSMLTGGIFSEASNAHELFDRVLKLSPVKRPLLGQPQ